MFWGVFRSFLGFEGVLVIKLAGGSEVTVVWARTPLAEIATAESRVAKKGTAKRDENIMTCLARGPQKWAPVLRKDTRKFSNTSGRTEMSGMKPPHSTP